MKAEEIKLAFQTNVQFAISDDLKASADALAKATQGINNSIKNYESAFKEMQTEKGTASSIVSVQTKVIANAEAKAKDLGISPSSIPNFNDANRAWTTANATIDKVNQY